MALNIISNYAANVAHRNLTAADKAATSSLAKLSSGSRVVSAKDDAAAMAIGARLAAEIMGLKQAAVNTGQATSMLQVADGAMSRISDILNRMKALSVQAGSGQLSSTERAMLDTEYQAMLSEITRISADTEFAGNTLVSGAMVVDRTSATAFALTQGVQDIIYRGTHTTSATNSIAYNTAGTFTVTTGEGAFTGSISSSTNNGTNMSTGTVVTATLAGSTNKIDIVLNTAFVVNTTRAVGTLATSGSSSASYTFKVGTGTVAAADDISVSVHSVSAASLSVSTTGITTVALANAASSAVSNAIDDMQTYRSQVGASQNRLEFAAANIATTSENTEAARSQLLDLDVASEMTTFVSKQILTQAGVAMLSQAQRMPQELLRLFQQ